MRQVELNKNDPRVSHLVRGYKGRRTIKITAATKINVADYWSDGSRDTTDFVELSTGRLLTPEYVNFIKQTQGNPYNLQIGEAELRPGIAAVIHVVFCGKDLGYRIKVTPEDFKTFEVKGEKND